MIYLIFSVVLVLVVLFILMNRNNGVRATNNNEYQNGIRVISYDEYQKRFNSLSDEEKLKELRQSLEFRERCFKRWPPEDDEDWVEQCLKVYGKKTNPHYDIEKAGIERIKKQIQEIENNQK